MGNIEKTRGFGSKIRAPFINPGPHWNSRRNFVDDPKKLESEFTSRHFVSDAISTSEDPRTEVLRRYSYGIALPSICLLGIIGNIFNLVVLTRKNMRGTAYIYMRGKLDLFRICLLG